MICQRVIYSGRVQGVGFRLTAQRVATGFAVGGFVRNLPAGEVELVAEGEADEVARFLAAVAQRMAGYIQNVTVRDESPSGQQGFQIRHG
jgi:acylphosphatase